MDIQVGYDIEVAVEQATPAVLLLDPHPSRDDDILEVTTQKATTTDGSQDVALTTYIDGFGNRCSRLSIPAGGVILSSQFLMSDSGQPDRVDQEAREIPVGDLPSEVLEYTLSSRYCEVDELSGAAWSLFGQSTPGWNRVQQICNFVNAHLSFGYHHARSTRSAAQAMVEGVGVCRDFAHLAVTLCRCMNIPARYCNGFLGDIGVPRDPAPMDYNAWFEVYLSGRWYTFDARHNVPRIGRVLVARGRDAADIPMIQTYGQHALKRFVVITDELVTA